MPRKTKPSSSDEPMPSLLDMPRAGSNLPEFTVSDLSRQLKRTVEETFGLVRVRGEISECKLHSSGHMYLTLKDETAILASVCWKGQVSKLGLRPELGMDVVCTGKLTTYMGQSKYQLVIESMALAGMGALLKLLEERRRKLAAEGLFDASRKQLLPYLPNMIGVVTSPTGAVIRDILHRLDDRFPRHVLVWPVAVQGEGAAAQITAAINGFNALPESGSIPRPDVLIVARGGGSVEDLMAFNEEMVVRAVADSMIPIISAVGHETDTTLIDHAADVRAPTPTAAAEMAVPVRVNLLAQVLDDGARLDSAMLRVVRDRKDHLGLMNRALGDPLRVIEPLLQRLDERTERFSLSWQSYLTKRMSRVAEAGGKLRHPRDVLALATQRLQNQTHRLQAIARERLHLAEKRLELLKAKLQSIQPKLLYQSEKKFDLLTAKLAALSPLGVLGRGYSLLHGADGHLITSITKMKRGDKVHIEMHDGSREAEVLGAEVVD